LNKLSYDVKKKMKLHPSLKPMTI